MKVLPWRFTDTSGGTRTGDSAGSAGATTSGALPVPPGDMPAWRSGRPLKRWCYAGLFSPELMLSAASVVVGPLRHGSWSLWDRRSGILETESSMLRPSAVRVGPESVEVRSGRARIELALTRAGDAVEVLSPHGRSYIWTRKTPVRADGHLALGLEVTPFSASGILDESAGYHAHRTEWEWTAGVGTSAGGMPVTWNLVRGVHDSLLGSERTVWLNGRASEVAPVRFSADLGEVRGEDGSLLELEEEARWSRSDGLGPILSSSYEAPFGRFTGMLPGGVELSGSDPCLGVVERHRARW